MKQSTRSKRLMMFFLILLVASASFYSKFSTAVVTSKSAIANGKKQNETELAKLNRLKSALASANLPESKPESLKESQIKFVYWIKDAQENYDVRVDAFTIQTRNFEGGFVQSPFNGVSQMPMDLTLTIKDYEKGKKFFEDMKSSFPVKIDKFEVNYPTVLAKVSLLGTN